MGREASPHRHTDDVRPLIRLDQTRGTESRYPTRCHIEVSVGAVFPDLGVCAWSPAGMGPADNRFGGRGCGRRGERCFSSEFGAGERFRNRGASEEAGIKRTRNEGSAVIGIPLAREELRLLGRVHPPGCSSDAGCATEKVGEHASARSKSSPACDRRAGARDCADRDGDASLCLNCGPPLRARQGMPSRVKSTGHVAFPCRRRSHPALCKRRSLHCSGRVVA